MCKEKYDNYLKFIDETLELAKTIPRYFSKFSNKIYCNHQKLTLFILMQKFKLTTRGIVSWIRSNKEIQLLLGFTRIPVHTTIVRFVAKIEKIIPNFLGIKQATIVAVDSTGFELESKSFYYATRWNSDLKFKKKKYMKLSIAIDTQKQTILSYKIRRKLRHDNIDFKELLRDLNVKYVVADKGYDDQKNRKFVFSELKAIPIIPKRRSHNFYGFLKGKTKIDGSNYHQRSKVETVFSVIKRKYGSVLRCRSYATQRAEVISKMIAYNLDRKLNYFIIYLRVAPEPYSIRFI